MSTGMTQDMVKFLHFCLPIYPYSFPHILLMAMTQSNHVFKVFTRSTMSQGLVFGPKVLVTWILSCNLWYVSFMLFYL